MTGATWGSTDLGGTVGTLHAGAALRIAHWPAEGEGEARGTIILVQGRAEFIEVYAEAIADLRQRGYAVITFDFRGQGASARKTREGGHVDRYTQYCDDLIAVTRYGAQIGLPRPFHIVAHSAGALAALLAAPVLAKDVERMMVLAPLVEVAKLPMSAGKARFVTGLLRWIGLSKKVASKKIKGPSQFAGNPLTSDPERYATLVALSEANPDLMTGAPTIGWVHAALKAMTRLERTMGRPLAIPTLFMASARDSIVSTPAIDRFAKSVPGGGYILVPDAEHQLLIERDELRNLFFAAFETFIMDAPVRLSHRKPARLSRPLRFEPAADGARTVVPAPAAVPETAASPPPPTEAPVTVAAVAPTPPTPAPVEPAPDPVASAPVEAAPPHEDVPAPEPASEEPAPEFASKAVLRRQKRTERLRKRLQRRRSALSGPDPKAEDAPASPPAVIAAPPPVSEPADVSPKAAETPSLATPVPPIPPESLPVDEATTAAPADTASDPKQEQEPPVAPQATAEPELPLQPEPRVADTAATDATPKVPVEAQQEDAEPPRPEPAPDSEPVVAWEVTPPPQVAPDPEPEQQHDDAKPLADTAQPARDIAPTVPVEANDEYTEQRRPETEPDPVVAKEVTPPPQVAGDPEPEGRHSDAELAAST
ncbi:MAG: alpha/beta fold hydrolase, partial [Pseudomonadota bacterium]